MILVDSNMVSSYDFVRCSEISHHINFIVVYRFQGKGKILFIFNRKTLLAVFHKLFLLHDKELNDRTRASFTMRVINTYCVLNTCMSDA